MGKEENAGNQHFFLFPQCFQLVLKKKKKKKKVFVTFILLSEIAFNLDKSKILSFGEELIHFS